MNPATEAEELGAGVLDYLRGFYPVADDMPPMYHTGAQIAQHLAAEYWSGGKMAESLRESLDEIAAPTF